MTWRKSHHRFHRRPQRFSAYRFIAPSLLLLAAFTAPPGITAPPAPEPGALVKHPKVEAALKVLDLWIDARLSDQEKPGLSIGIIHDQELIWAKGYGFANMAQRTPATPKTLYRIASNSKLFTATGILQLRDAGKLQLDDPVAKHLPRFKIINRHPDGPVITIRHLLTHTSGLPREAVGQYWSDGEFPSRDEMLDGLARQETAYPAETRWKYSNLAISLAGEIITAVSGQPYPRYIEEHVLRPLNMLNTHVLPEPSTPGLAVPYGIHRPGRPRTIELFTRSGGLTPAANLASSVEDLAKFASLQFRGGPAGGAQILKGSTLREMRRVHWLQPDWKSGWGLGFSIRREKDEVFFGHGGSVLGNRTQIMLSAKRKLGVIVLMNATDGDPQTYARKAFELLSSPIAEAVKPFETPPVADPAWKKYTGVYTGVNFGHAVHVLVLDGVLTVLSPHSDNPWKSRLTLTPAGEHRFRIEIEGSAGGPAGELAIFEADSAGRVVAMRMPGSLRTKQ